MFGYIAPVLKALTEEQQNRYRAAYCGVCHALKDRFGEVCRVSLSNDMTFLALLLDSMAEPEQDQRKARCLLHPIHPRPYVISPGTDYAADMNALLFYYKCHDQRIDDHTAAGALGEKAFRRAMDEVKARHPRQAEAVETALEELWRCEKDPQINPDVLCNLSGRMLGAIFVPDEKDYWTPELYALGEGLGRFIYWMDAWEDYDADIKRGRFNPLRLYHDRPDYEAFALDTLELFMGEAAAHFEILPLVQDLDLLRNVVYSGVWQRYTLLNRRRESREARRAPRAGDEDTKKEETPT